MEVTVSTLATVLTLAASVKTWLDEIKERDSTIIAVTQDVDLICAILQPFKDLAHVEPTVKSSLFALGDALARTKEHLSVWASRRQKKGLIKSIVSLADSLQPSTDIKQLKADQQQLSQQITLLLFSFAANNYTRERLPRQIDQSRFSQISISNDELRKFWQGYFGFQTYSVSIPKFRQALRQYLGHEINEVAFNSLIFRLDEFAIGQVTLANLTAFIGNQSLQSQVRMLEGLTYREPLSTYDPSQLPLLVWVDDIPSNNEVLVRFAQSRNVKVIQLQSTALAKDWIERHEVLLRGNDAAQRIRFISDNARFEIDRMPQGNGQRARSFLNIRAGENILRYLRGRRFNFSVLIFCGQSIDSTQYVLSYSNAGSTVSSAVVQRYIGALADGREDDKDWKNFKVW